MPNPTIKPQPLHSEPRDSWMPENGYLSVVPGGLIAAGSQRLPAPGPGVTSPCTADVEVPDRGRMRITYLAREYRHHRSRHWGWRAVRADRVED